MILTCFGEDVEEGRLSYVWETWRRVQVRREDEMDEDWNRPTIPIFRLFPGLPRRIFFSAAAAFFGGMVLFFAEATLDAWNALRRLWR